MPDNALVHQVAVAGPATHVIAIGIGQYDHLPGGSGRQTAYDLGLKQISTPSPSARAIASWFIENFDCTERPLGSVSLVLSEKTPTPFTNAKTGATYDNLPTGLTEEVRQALHAWMGRAGTNPDNAAILYFCGHGFGVGLQNYYLLRDYGADEYDPLRGALNFKNFVSGLGTCRPTYQFLLFDACRTDNPVVNLNQDGGQSIFIANPAGRLQLPEVQQCPVFSAEPDQAALGRPGQPSLCAQAFIRIMNGAAARRDGSPDWYVTTHAIVDALTDFQKREAKKGGKLQLADANKFAKFRLRRLGSDRPRIPVFVRIEDQARRPLLVITAERQNEPPEIISDPTKAGWVEQEEWVTDIKIGDCEFKAVHIHDPAQKWTITDVVIPSHLEVRF